MFCRKCGDELRSESRFCKRCGVPIVNQPARGETNPRRTVNLPRDENPLRTTGLRAPDQNERPPTPPVRNAPPVPPVNRGPKKSDSDISWMSERAQRDLPPLVQSSRAKTVIRNQLATSPISMPVQREPEAKPFFTQALTADKSPQHRRLVAVVPLLLLAVILLFIFAYIAGR
jgi:zinc-ribbon domain